jgi:riboflavin kinase/FMN adenylyltransferase
MSRPRAVVSVGVFDGLHRGHQAILERAVGEGRARGLPVGVVSFDPHPDVVLRKGPFRASLPLTPLGEKRGRLEAVGVAWVEVLPFTRELAGFEPAEFVTRYLLGPHDLACMVVGEDFALGRGRSGNVARLRELGAAAVFAVVSVPLVAEGGRPITSTRIREELAEGRVAEAARLLGRPYSLAGMVVKGEGMGRTLGYPTANLRLHEEKWLPRDGIYVVRVLHGDRALAGAMSIGVRPTFGGQVRTLEVFILDFEADLLGQDLTVEFLEWLRPERRFDTPALLVQAMHRDVAQVRERFAGSARSAQPGAGRADRRRAGLGARPARIRLPKALADAMLA